MVNKNESYLLLILTVCVIVAIIVVCIIRKSRRREKKLRKLNPVAQKDVRGYSSIGAEYDSPYILDDVMSKSQCLEIMLRSKKNLKPSPTVGGINTKVRNSEQTWISKSDPFVRNLYNKISMIVGIPWKNAEDLQIVRYKPGQYYNEHHDACCDDQKLCDNFVKNGGQRILTVLIYLNSEFEGGRTRFPNLGMEFKPLPGSAVVFSPVASGSTICHPLALHAGTPVTSGEKWIANIWFRENECTSRMQI